MDANPKESKKKKAGLAKKLPAVDQRVASALKNSRSLFQELDADHSGTIDETEFAALMEKMMLAVEAGQFAAIDTDGSVRPVVLSALQALICCCFLLISLAYSPHVLRVQGAIEYGEFVVWLAECGMQQSSQAFHAGWCAVLGVG